MNVQDIFTTIFYSQQSRTTHDTRRHTTHDTTHTHRHKHSNMHSDEAQTQRRNHTKLTMEVAADLTPTQNPHQHVKVTQPHAMTYR